MASDLTIDPAKQPTSYDKPRDIKQKQYIHPTQQQQVVTKKSMLKQHQSTAHQVFPIRQNSEVRTNVFQNFRWIAKRKFRTQLGSKLRIITVQLEHFGAQFKELISWQLNCKRRFRPRCTEIENRTTVESIDQNPVQKGWLTGLTRVRYLIANQHEISSD